jgi:hypothetical protein
VETLASGSGVVVPAQNVASGSSVTGFAISRDQFNNFVANVAATWSLANVTGGVVSGDLVTAADTKSAAFTGHVIGSADLHIVVSGLTSTDSGLITVTIGPATQVRVETATNGSGTIVAAQNVTTGGSVTGFAIRRDASGNFIDNVAATWSLGSITGGVVNGDLVAAADNRSAIFTGHFVGSAKMHAAAGLTSVDSGTLTVVAANLSALSVSGFPSPVTAGTAGNVTVVAKDSFGNTITNYLERLSSPALTRNGCCLQVTLLSPATTAHIPSQMGSLSRRPASGLSQRRIPATV